MSKEISADKGRTIRAAIVGLGMGRHHIPAWRRHPRCEVVAVCDIDPAKVTRAKREFNIKHGFMSWEDLLDDGEFDVVSLVLPNHLHEPVTIAFLEAGFHVLAEKPLALDAEKGRRIVEAARKAAKKSGIKASLHMNQRVSPEHQLIRRAVDRGELGDIYYIRTGWMRKRGIPTGASNWFVQKRHAGGGPLIDLGVHMLDSALFIAGFPKVRSVSGQTCSHFADRDLGDDSAMMDVEDFATACIRCENDLTIVLEVSWASFHHDPNHAFMHVYGTQAGAHRNTSFDLDWNPTTELLFSRRNDVALSQERIEELPRGFPTVQEDLVDAILHDRPPLCPLEEGLTIMEVLDAVYRSAEQGTEVHLHGA